MKRTVAIVFAATATTFVSSASAAQDCKLQRVASVPMIAESDGRVSIPVIAQGHELHLLLSLASVASGLKTSAVAVLGTRVRNDDKSRVTVGGFSIQKFTIVQPFSIGTLSAPQMELSVIPDTLADANTDGILGADILHNYDVDLDFKQNQLNLFSQDHCKGQVVYWTRQAYAEIPIKLEWFKQITVPVQMDGQDFIAEIDTTSPASYTTLETVRRAFGWGDQPDGLKRMGTSDEYIYPFKSLTFSGVSINNPAIIVHSDEPGRRAYDKPWMLIGMDILRQMHVYIAYDEKSLYVTSASAQ